MDNDGLDELDYEEVMTNRTTALTNNNIIYSINQQQKETKQETKQESQQKKTKQKCNKLNDKKCKFYILSEFI